MTKNVKVNIEVDVTSLKEEATNELVSRLKESFQKQINTAVHDNYEYGHYIKKYINEWVHKNLETLVKKELESVDLKKKVEQAVERATLDIVRNQLKKISL